MRNGKQNNQKNKYKMDKDIFTKRNCFRCQHCEGYDGEFCKLHEKASGTPCDSFSYDKMCMNCKHWKKRLDPIWRIDGICMLQDNFPMWHNHPACAFVQPKEEKKKINMKDAILGFVDLFVIVPIWLVIAIPAFLVYWLNNAFQWLFRLLSCGLLMCLNGFDGKKTREYINKVKKEI